MSGIYIHVPFCLQACRYCDFHFSTTFEVYRKEMIDAICLEITSRSKYLQNQEKYLIRTLTFQYGDRNARIPQKSRHWENGNL